MTKLNKYYETILERIEKLIQEKKYDEAFEIVKQEIASPYISLEYIDRFERLYVDLNKIVLVNQIKNQYNNMSKMEMLGKIFDDKKFDINLFSFMLGKFHKDLESLDLEYINKIFKSKNISNSEKIFALQQMKLVNLVHAFDYFNNALNQTFSINLNDDFEYNKHPYFLQVKDQVNQVLLKNPSIATICNELLLLIYEHYFGSQPSYDTNILANKLSDYVQTYFEPEHKSDREFQK
jgi:hypothetical protein